MGITCTGNLGVPLAVFVYCVYIWVYIYLSEPRGNVCCHGSSTFTSTLVPTATDTCTCSNFQLCNNNSTLYNTIPVIIKTSTVIQCNNH